MPKVTMSMENLDRFSVDPETNKLYWDGKEVVASMSLPWWVNVSAIATAVFTGIGAVAAVVVTIHTLLR